MINKIYNYEKIEWDNNYYYRYYKCFYIFKWLIYRKQIDFGEFLENGGVIC